MTDRYHGTYAMYQHECKDPDLEPCDLCREANRKYMRDLRARSPKIRVRNNRYNGARQRALRRLSQAHRGEFLRLFSQELEEAERS